MNPDLYRTLILIFIWRYFCILASAKKENIQAISKQSTGVIWALLTKSEFCPSVFFKLLCGFGLWTISPSGPMVKILTLWKRRVF